MSDNMRALVSLGLTAVAVALAGVLYHSLPATAGAFGRLIVSANLALPLFVVALLVGPRSHARGQGDTRRLLLGTAVVTLVMAREAARMRGTAVPPMLAVAYQGILLMLLGTMAWAWWKARRPSPAAGVDVR
ncbi:hypothetical protein [Gemmatimonas sp.]|uniref:hypothetical protein n=1 Tax=Gemmatimonas sp. TaxID=1962908 RepID=UPI00286DA9F0|nr:hypothetical protein [Gemmatimonas sp.]